MFTPPAKAASSTEAPTSQLTNNFLGTTLEDAAASGNRSLLAEAAVTESVENIPPLEEFAPKPELPPPSQPGKSAARA